MSRSTTAATEARARKAYAELSVTGVRLALAEWPEIAQAVSNRYRRRGGSLDRFGPRDAELMADALTRAEDEAEMPADPKRHAPRGAGGRLRDGDEPEPDAPSARRVRYVLRRLRRRFEELAEPAPIARRRRSP
ncbi:MAG: hypothetical protein WKG00_17800 [Polyangiaceae bacterium]